jgi:anaerobic magnesium-protoporphyrin IX monomethyl ester cyclase
MDLLLIDPPHSILKGQSTDRGYGLGLTSLAAYLRKNGIDTAILAGDLLMGPSSINKIAFFIPGWLRANVKTLAAGQRRLETIVDDKTHIIWKRVADTVRQTKPLAVGIPYYTPLKYVVEIITGLVREVNPDIKIIVGAFHPTFCPDEVLQNPDIDFIVRGEGEIPLLNLVQEIKKDSRKWATVPGLSYRDAAGHTRHNDSPDLISNLDELPFPARDAVLNCDFNTHRHHSILTTRGCTYTCAFCGDRRLWGGRVRRRSVNNVLEELKSLKETYKVKYIEIVDGTFTYDRKYLETFCRALIDQQVNIKWGCTARYDNLDKDILKLMKQSKCYGLYLGLESGSNRVLSSIDKKETIERDIEVSKLIYDSGILSATSILLGSPDEEKEDIEATLKLMRHFKTDFFDINSYMPLPGTPLYDAMEEDDRKKIDWRKVGLKSFENYFSKHLSREELNGYRNEAYEISNKLRRRNIPRLALRRIFG